MSSFDFNRDCRCLTIDTPELSRQLEQAGLAHGLSSALLAQHAHLFASVPVYVDRPELLRMSTIVRAIENVVARPGYRDAVLASAPEIARHEVKQLGVFFGYDFHLGSEGPQLIEINTNAGGALLNVFLARSQRACCKEMEELVNGPHPTAELEEVFVAMFRAEWQRARGDAPLKRIAIIDDAPSDQYLYPEFLMFRELFKTHGIAADVVDARSLKLEGGVLRDEVGAIDLVYNRVTDFYFASPEHAALREAYLSDAAVITPHPRAHALFADKRNLVLLSDLTFLASLDLPADVMTALAEGIPKTIIVDKADAEVLWADRKRNFFKPVHGYGSKAAYRGDKLTKSTFAEILERDYVAQRIVPPSERTILIEDREIPLKLDVRAYTYAGETQLFASRLYHGQTTNFRTQGGGFAPVFTQPALPKVGFAV